MAYVDVDDTLRQTYGYAPLDLRGEAVLPRRRVERVCGGGERRLLRGLRREALAQVADHRAAPVGLAPSSGLLATPDPSLLQIHRCI